jgi:transposase
MRVVAPKTTAQQDVQALHRLRERCLQERTALCNQLRGLLAEYGCILPKGVNVICRRIPELLEDGENGLSGLFRQLLAQGYQQLQELDGHIDFYTRELQAQCHQDEACGRLLHILTHRDHSF